MTGPATHTSAAGGGDASSNSAATFKSEVQDIIFAYCAEALTAEQAMQQIIEALHAIPNRAPWEDCERFDSAGGYCIEGKDCTCDATRNSVADTKAALEKYRAHCIGESNRLLGNANWCERLLRQMEDDGA